MFPMNCLESALLLPRKDCEDFEAYKKWVLATYGDGNKTKTITWTKYLRIHKVLTGRSLGESPKFKFWVKSKGFRFLPCANPKGRPSEMSGYVIVVPNKKTSVEQVYKRVAVVEEFFDIVYDIHTNIDGRTGKHAGQKRTYRSIIESYAFLPREAVTHFLMSCKDCRGRMHLTEGKTCWLQPRTPESPSCSPPLSFGALPATACSSPTPSSCDSIDVDSLDSMCDQMIMSAEDSETSTASPSVPSEVESKGKSTSSQPEILMKMEADTITEPTMDSNNKDSEKENKNEVSDEEISTESKVYRTKIESTNYPIMPPLSTPLKRPASYSMSPMSKKSSDNEDDDDDDDEEKYASTNNDIDPERLKAFNMFCRLFVDENLDRLVPISKQPKDKVQAILDACDRQFPEFHDRARKRIRTYLKSCRRMRRAREMNGWENVSFRPTPPHLTSPIAESLLSQACENESQNAKRMRMGLEPIAMAPPAKPSATVNGGNSIPKTTTSMAAVSASMPSLLPSSLAQASSQAARMFPEWRFPPNTASAAQFRPDLAPFFANGFLRPPFPGFPGFPSAAALQASQVANQLALHAQGGAADLNLKKSSTPTTSTSTPTKNSSSLSTTEISTIRQLISGYRESATFLYRSADELEQLISQARE